MTHDWNPTGSGFTQNGPRVSQQLFSRLMVFNDLSSETLPSLSTSSLSPIDPHELAALATQQVIGAMSDILSLAQAHAPLIDGTVNSIRPYIRSQMTPELMYFQTEISNAAAEMQQDPTPTPGRAETLKQMNATLAHMLSTFKKNLAWEIFKALVELIAGAVLSKHIQNKFFRCRRRWEKGPVWAAWMGPLAGLVKCETTAGRARLWRSPVDERRGCRL